MLDKLAAYVGILLSALILFALIWIALFNPEIHNTQGGEKVHPAIRGIATLLGAVVAALVVSICLDAGVRKFWGITHKE